MKTPTIGASELAVVVGLQRRRRDGTPYDSELALWARLRGLVPRYDTSSSPAADCGRDLEPGMALRYGAERGVAVLPGPQLTEPGLSHPDFPWLHVRPDFLVPQLARGLECKAPRELGDDWGRPGSDEVPVYYAVQVLAQLAVLVRLYGWEVVDLAARARDTWREDRAWVVYHLLRDEVVEADVLARARDWYRRHVEDGAPPVVDGSLATRQALAAIWRPTDRTVVATDEDLAVIERLLRARSAIEEIEAERRELEARLQARLADATVLERDGRRLATWRPRKGSDCLDLARLRRERPDIVSTYAKTGAPGRTFRLET